MSLRIKGYVLTYLGYVVACTLAGITSLTFGYLFFTNEAPSVIDDNQDIAVAAALGMGLVAIILMTIVFLCITLIGSVLTLRYTLKNYPKYHTATTVWLCLLLLISPLILILDWNNKWHFVGIGSWLLLIPFFSRIAATHNR